MPPTTIYHLTFPRGIHIGARGVNSVDTARDTAPSDTLFSALFVTALSLGKPANLLPEPDKPAFRVTSAFPFAGGVRFYPRPVNLLELFKKETLQEESAGKGLKKIRYLSEGLLFKAASGETLEKFRFPGEEYAEPVKGVALQGGEFWLLPEEVGLLPASWQKAPKDQWQLRRAHVFKADTLTRVTVDRINTASSVFSAERYLFNEGCGLWFGAQGQTDWLDNLLTVLGEAGLGGKRTAGYGHFSWQRKKTADWETPREHAYLLSRWHPKNDEISLLQNPKSAYKLEAIDGWSRAAPGQADQRRQRLWLVAEGSLIAGNPQGDAVDVKPRYAHASHPVWRAGFALGLNWKLKH